MSRLLRSGALAALIVAASCGVAGAASAQTYERLVVFGDSLSDNGNFYAATGSTLPPSPPYYQGRFSTGPVFTELLGFNLGRVGGNVNGSIDYAYGFARTDSSLSPPGMQTQLGMYLGAGGTFDSSDLVSILGGANNIFQGLPAAGAAANPIAAITPVATGAAADVNGLVNAVAGAGAGTILVTNLPKLSLTPEFRGTAAAPLADFAVSTFNTALSNGLAVTAAARPGTNIIMMDIFKIGDAIAADPEGFGVSNVTNRCIDATTFARCSNPDDYFYADGVHPTGAGHRVLASLANDYLYYADRGAAAALLGETGIRHREDGLDAATEALSGHAPWRSGTALTFAGSIDRTETDARGVVSEARSDGWGARVGLETGPSDHVRVGLVGGYRNAEVEAGALDFSVESFSLDLYTGWRSDGGAFVTAAAGAAADSYTDIKRQTGVGPVVHTAETDGVSTGARLQGGVWFDLGGLAVSPRAAITWSSSEVEGYFESGVAAQYEYADRDISGFAGEVAVRAEGDLGGLAFFVEGGYRDSLSDDYDPVRIGIRANTAQVLEREVEEPFGGQILASAGLEGEVGPFKLTAAYRGRFGDHADSHMGGLTLVLPLQ